MPAWEADAPGRGPLHSVRGTCLLPEGEVGGIALLAVHLDTRPGLHVVEALARQLAVVGERGNVVIYAVADHICVTLLYQALDEVYHILDVLGGGCDNGRAIDVQAVHVPEEGVRVKAGDLPD